MEKCDRLWKMRSPTEKCDRLWKNAIAYGKCDRLWKMRSPMENAIAYGKMRSCRHKLRGKLIEGCDSRSTECDCRWRKAIGVKTMGTNGQRRSDHRVNQ